MPLCCKLWRGIWHLDVLCRNRVHPYLIQDATAKQCWDAACAAKYWKENCKDSADVEFNGFEDNFYTLAMGYSQGGSVALAVQNFIQNNDSSDRLRLKGFTIEDYLKPEVITALKNGTDNVWNMIDSKDKSTTDIDNVIKNAVGEKGSAYIPVSKMITNKATNPNSDAYKALKAALDGNNLTNTAKWSGGKNNKTIAAMHW